MKKLIAQLSKRGPERVLVGDSSFAGLAGKVYTPAKGKRRPGVVFAHDWMKGSPQYHATLRHLASWGIAVLAPDTATGFLPDPRGLAEDCQSALQILSSVKLGTGEVIISPERLGIIGHGAGCSAAMMATNSLPEGAAAPKAFVGLFPADSQPPATSLAAEMTIPGLIIGGKPGELTEKGNPRRVALNYGGDITYREIDEARADEFAESPLWTRLLGVIRPNRGVQQKARAMMTGYLLYHLTGDDDYAAFAQLSTEFTGATSLSRGELADFFMD